MAESNEHLVLFPTLRHTSFAMAVWLKIQYGTLMLVTTSGYFNCLTTFHKIKHTSFAAYALKRLIRTMPTLIAVVMMHIIYWQLSSFPVKRTFGLNDSCERNWWRTLLLVNNYDSTLREMVIRVRCDSQTNRLVSLVHLAKLVRVG